jgi:glycosyltransferase involved in cell wall biosynthesis
MKQVFMNISIVIPVYNEAAHLRACLEAISRQTMAPFEVIVVDNNSTDATAFIAQQFPFVRLLQEPKQGVVHARNRGFNAVRGEIIARIDADTVLPANWLEQVAAIMRDKSIAAVSGAPHYHDFALSGVADKIDRFFRTHLARKLANENFLWGANMAVRKSAWLAVQKQGLCAEAGLHEDFDLGIHLQEAGFRVAYDERLVANVSSRRVDTGFWAFVRYGLVSPKTYAAHGLQSRRHMYPVLLVTWACYFPGRILYRGYNPKTGNFSLAHIFVATTARIDPTTNASS